ncbi:MAG: hypothetical protein M0Z47_07985 [Actinomycetota bacterium]|nr:hypothetical protein [Actinomycetota bacterium]
MSTFDKEGGPRVLGWSPRWTATGLLVTAALFRSAQNAGLTTFSLLAKSRLGAGAETVGTLGAVSGAVMVLAAWLLAAKLANRASASMVAAGAVVLAAGLIVIASTTTMAQMALGVVLLGAAGGVTPPSLATAVGEVGQERREKQLARYATVLSASLAGGPLLEAAILYLSHQDVRIAFFVFAPFPLVALALGIKGGVVHKRASPRPPANPRIDPVTPGEDPSTQMPARSSSSPGEPVPRVRKGRPGREVLLGTSAGRVALIMQLLYSVPFAMVTVFGALVARNEFGMNAAHSQLGFTTFFVASLISRVVVMRLSPIKAKLAVFAACIALTIAGLVMLSLGGPAAVFFVAMVLLGVPHGVIFPLALSLVASAARDGQLAAANAGMFATVAMVSAISPALLGAVAGALDYQLMTASVLVPVIACTLILVVQRKAITAYAG